MPKVLVCTVGGQPFPILNALKQNTGLDRIYFLCSTGTEENASDVTIEKATINKIPAHCPHCEKDYTATKKMEPIAAQAALSRDRYAIERIQDPDDLTQVVRACESIDEDVRKRWPEGNVEVVANYTGGTKTMSLGLGLYALRRGSPWWLQVNRTIDRSNIRRIETGDVALPQDLSHLLAQAAAERAGALAERHDYAGAEAVLEATLAQERLRSEDQRRLLGLCQRHAFRAAWDRLDYRQALELARRNRELAAEHAEALSRLLRIAEALGGDDPWPKGRFTGLELVEDLRANAERAAARGRYDDAVGRLYRATELLAQVKLRRDYGIRTSNVDPAHPKIPDDLRPELERHRTSPKAIKIGLLAAYELLAAMNDPLGTYFAEHRGALLYVIEKRNQTLFAHGLTPVDRKTWTDVAPRWQQWLDEAQEACR